MIISWVSLVWSFYDFLITKSRSSHHPEVFLRKDVWKYAANLQENTHAEVRSQITLRHWGSPVNLLHIFRTPFRRTPLNNCFWKSNFVQFYLRNCENGDIFWKIANLINSNLINFWITFLFKPYWKHEKAKGVFSGSMKGGLHWQETG